MFHTQIVQPALSSFFTRSPSFGSLFLHVFSCLHLSLCLFILALCDRLFSAELVLSQMSLCDVSCVRSLIEYCCWNQHSASLWWPIRQHQFQYLLNQLCSPRSGWNPSPLCIVTLPLFCPPCLPPFTWPFTDWNDASSLTLIITGKLLGCAPVIFNILGNDEACSCVFCSRRKRPSRMANPFVSTNSSDFDKPFESVTGTNIHVHRPTHQSSTMEQKCWGVRDTNWWTREGWNLENTLHEQNYPTRHATAFDVEPVPFERSWRGCEGMPRVSLPDLKAPDLHWNKYRRNFVPQVQMLLTDASVNPQLDSESVSRSTGTRRETNLNLATFSREEWRYSEWRRLLESAGK